MERDKHDFRKNESKIFLLLGEIAAIALKILANFVFPGDTFFSDSSVRPRLTGTSRAAESADGHAREQPMDSDDRDPTGASWFSRRCEASSGDGDAKHRPETALQASSPRGFKMSPRKDWSLRLRSHVRSPVWGESIAASDHHRAIASISPHYFGQVGYLL